MIGNGLSQTIRRPMPCDCRRRKYWSEGVAPDRPKRQCGVVPVNANQVVDQIGHIADRRCPRRAAHGQRLLLHHLPVADAARFLS